MRTDEGVLPPPTHVSISGVEVATYVLEPERTAIADVVLCHGTPWSAQVWAQVACTLSHDYRVFLWDMPGYGQSTMDVTVALDLPSQMNRLGQLLANWELSQPHVIAHDIGGAVALGAHLHYGVDYADLFLWDVVTLEPWGSPFFTLVADHSEVFADLPPRLHAALVKEYIAGAALHHLSPAMVDTLAQPWLTTDGQRAFYRQIAALSPDDTRPIVQRLGMTRCPVRIGWGAEDPWIPVAQAHQLQEQLPGTPDVVTLFDTGHLGPIENPTDTAHAIGAWLHRR